MLSCLFFIINDVNNNKINKLGFCVKFYFFKFPVRVIKIDINYTFI